VDILFYIVNNSVVWLLHHDNVDLSY